MNRLEKYVGIRSNLLKSGWFWGNLLFVLLGGMFIPRYGFFCILVALGFNILRGALYWGSEDSIKKSTSGYIIGLALYFVAVVIFK